MMIKKIIHDEDEIDTTLDSATIDISSISSMDVGTIDISSMYPSMLTSKVYVDSLGELSSTMSSNEDVLLEAFKSIAFEEPNDLAKTLIEYYYELKHNPEGERIKLLKKKLEDEHNINL